MQKDKVREHADALRDMEREWRDCYCEPASWESKRSFRVLDALRTAYAIMVQYEQGKLPIDSRETEADG